MMLAATSSWLVIRAPNRTRLASGITIGRSGSGPKHARHRADEAAVTNFRILHNRVDDRAARLADAYFADERHAVRVNVPSASRRSPGHWLPFAEKSSRRSLSCRLQATPISAAPFE